MCLPDALALCLPMLHHNHFAYGHVYVGVMKGLFAINATTGEIVWICQVGGAIVDKAAVGGERVYLGCEDGVARSLRPAST